MGLRLIRKFVCHSGAVLRIAARYGWSPGARYTNLRDVRRVRRLGFLDIDWGHYDFSRHLAAAQLLRPEVTVAQDILDIKKLPQILFQADQLSEYAAKIVIVPKDPKLASRLCDLIPEKFLLGYSVPTRYGGTTIPLEAFNGRPVHLLGGRPDKQRQLAETLNVVSVDTNRFTLDAAFGDYFDGETFRPHPKGGYETCLKASIKNINSLWANYIGPRKKRRQSNG